MIEVRRCHETDLEPARAILNRIIEIGGTTAYEEPVSTDYLAAKLLDGAPNLISTHVALDPQGQVAAFQYLVRSDGLPEGVADIASFARPEPRLKGAGRALFTATVAAARAAGCHEINAQIRADNLPGLGYYTAMGFVDHDVIRGVPLRDGTPVDRIVKRYRLDA